MKIYYRISDAGYKKVKASYINNENCLKNFTTRFLDKNLDDITVLADNVCTSTFNMISSYVASKDIILCNKGSGAQTFNLALSMALNNSDDDIVYFVENDYIHRANSRIALTEAFELGADFVCLYDHPDKYLNANQGGNPFIENNGEITQVFLTKSCHWKLTNSTTMSFATKVKTLKKYEAIFKKWTVGTYPQDFRMFIEFRELGLTLLSPIPSYSTHGDAPWIAPLINWENEL